MLEEALTFSKYSLGQTRPPKNAIKDPAGANPSMKTPRPASVMVDFKDIEEYPSRSRNSRAFVMLISW